MFFIIIIVSIMPRKSRIDYPGALNHVMVRGIERRNIFSDTKDKQFFTKRLGTVLTDTGTNCFAFALMDNHFHLLLQTGVTSISSVMQSLLTGYAVTYNDRHGRTGKLYQNRFKSILCDKEEYLLQLIRYIHLNPIRVGLVKNLSELDRSPWTGHSVLMGRRHTDWLDTEEVLSNFGRTAKEARKAYREYIQAGITEPETTDLSGGGLVRSIGGAWEALKAAGKGQKPTADERILGSGEFVEKVFKEEEELESRSSKLKREGWDFSKVLDTAAQAVGVDPEELMIRGRSNKRSYGRALLCKWMVEDLKKPQIEIAKRLDISHPAVSKLVQKGRRLEREMGINLSEIS